MNPAVPLLFAAHVWLSLTAANYEAKLFADTNAWRIQHGRLPLAHSLELASAARQRALDGRTHFVPVEEYRTHRASDGASFLVYLAQRAPNARGLNENLCRAVDGSGWAHLDGAIGALQSSRAHREAWLSPVYGHLGTGASLGPSGPHAETLYIVQVFAISVGREGEVGEVVRPLKGPAAVVESG